jgi:ABC-type Fe3+-hydroxamate transport system substrate-binding protein
MIRRNTWLLLILLLALVGFAFYLRNQKAQQAASTTPTAAAASTPLFSAAFGAPTDITVKDSSGKTVEVTRNEKAVWVLKAPTDTQADQAAAESAATQVTSLQVLSGVQLDLNVVGLDKPTYTMSFKFTDGSSHTLQVGSLTPIQDGYYTSLDGGPIKIVDKQGLDALTQLLSQPPYAQTPVPPITLTPTLPTATPTSTIAMTATPVPATSDTPAATAPAASTPTP